MSVIVKGMEMPDTCEECQLMADRWCYGVKNQPGTIYFHARPDWCPLAPMPEKHGPMIDCQALLEEARRLSGPFVGDGWSNQGVFSLIARQPTIVEAEGDDG